MALNFPNLPSNGQSFQAAGREWIWDGTSWKLQGTASSYVLPIAGVGVTGELGGVKIGSGLQINATTGLLDATGTGGGGGIDLTDLSVTQNLPSGTGTLSYNSNNGVFTYTPPSTSSGVDLTAFSVTQQPATGTGNLTYNNGTGVFEYTPPDLSSFLTSLPNHSLNDHTDVVITGTPADGAVLKYDSSANSGNGAWIVGSDNVSGGGSGVGNLQQVTDQGNTTTNSITTGGLVMGSWNGGNEISVGDSQELEIYHQDSTNDVFFVIDDNNDAKFFYPGNGEWIIERAGNNVLFTTTADGIKIKGSFEDKDGSYGTTGQILSSTGTELKWIPAPSGGGGGANVTTADTPPSNPNDGDLWWNSTSGDLKVYYQDTDSSQWVDANSGGGTTGSGTNTTYDLTAAGGSIATEEKIVLTGSDNSEDSVILAVDPSSNLTIARSNNTITFGGGGGGGSTNPGGSNTQLQWNDDGDFAGTSKITWDNSNSDLVFEGTTVSNALRWDSSQSVLRLESSSVKMQFVGDAQHVHTIEQSSDYLMVSAKGAGSKLYLDAISTIKFITSADAANVLLEAFDDGPVNLYHGYSKKFETTLSGVQVTGGIQDKDGDLGTPGQVLSSTGSELDWVDPVSTGIPVLDVTNWSSTPDDNVGTGKTGTVNRDAFQKAIGSLVNKGGIIYVPHGDYPIQGTINITNTGNADDGNVGDGGGIVIMGPNYRVGAADSEGARLIAQSPGEDIFKITNVRNVEIKQLAFDSAVTRTGGSAIHCYSNTNTQQIKLERLYIRQQFGGIKMDGHSMSILRDIEMRQFNDIANSYGLMISASTVATERVDQIRCQNVLIDGEVVAGNSNEGNASNNTVGIQIKDFVNSVWFDHCVSNRCKYGMDFHTSMPSGGTGNPGSFFRVNDCDFDTNSFCGINVEGGSFIWINSPYISSNKYNGLRTTSNFTGVLRINDADCRGNSEHGILIDSPGHKKVMINNPQCCENGAGTWNGTGDGNGIDIGNGVNDVQIQGGQCGGTNMGETIGTEGDFNRSARAQKYGIHFDSGGAGTHHRCTVAFVDCTDNATDPIQFNVQAGDFNYLIGVAGNGNGSTFWN